MAVADFRVRQHAAGTTQGRDLGGRLRTQRQVVVVVTALDEAVEVDVLGRHVDTFALQRRRAADRLVDRPVGRIDGIDLGLHRRPALEAGDDGVRIAADAGIRIGNPVIGRVRAVVWHHARGHAAPDRRRLTPHRILAVRNVAQVNGHVAAGEQFKLPGVHRCIDDDAAVAGLQCLEVHHPVDVGDRARHGDVRPGNVAPVELVAGDKIVHHADRRTVRSRRVRGQVRDSRADFSECSDSRDQQSFTDDLVVVVFFRRRGVLGVDEVVAMVLCVLVQWRTVQVDAAQRLRDADARELEVGQGVVDDLDLDVTGCVEHAGALQRVAIDVDHTSLGDDRVDGNRHGGQALGDAAQIAGTEGNCRICALLERKAGCIRVGEHLDVVVMALDVLRVRHRPDVLDACGV